MRQSPVKCMHNILGYAGKSLNMYAMYKVRIISQNSRRKVIAEGERSNVLYCMHSTLQSAARSLKKRCTVSRPKMKIQGLSKQLPIFRCKGTDQHVRIRSKMAFQDQKSSCNFFAFYTPIWPLFPSFLYRKKWLRVYFLFAFKILKHRAKFQSQGKFSWRIQTSTV